MQCHYSGEEQLAFSYIRKVEPGTEPSGKNPPWLLLLFLLEESDTKGGEDLKPPASTPLVAFYDTHEIRG